MVDINGTIQNVTDVVNQTVAQPVMNAVSQATGQPNILQQIGSGIKSAINSVIPGYELWIVLGASAFAGWYLQRKMEIMTKTAVWFTLSLLIFLALKYIGL